eukprot:g38018.t1
MYGDGHAGGSKSDIISVDRGSGIVGGGSDIASIRGGSDVANAGGSDVVNGISGRGHGDCMVNGGGQTESEMLNRFGVCGGG